MLLAWGKKDSGEIVATHVPYQYVVWNDVSRKTADLRIIRRELTQGVIIPYEDFRLTVDTVESAQALAEKIDELFQPFNEFNQPGWFV